MFSEKCKHIICVLVYVIGIMSGLSGGVSFSTLYHNEPAMIWAYYSGCLALACMVIELLRHHGMLQVCCTPSSLWVVSAYALLSLATTTILFLVHLSVGIRNRESVAGKSALDHSDFIVAVWTFLTAKYCLSLYFVSKKSRHALMEQLSSFRVESPDFQSMRHQAPHADSPDFPTLRYQTPHAESLDSQPIGRRPRGAPNDGTRRRSTSDGRRKRRSGRRRRRSAERADLLSDASPMPAESQLAASTDSESAGDMDEAAHRLNFEPLSV